jgi:hypothetical protein
MGELGAWRGVVWEVGEAKKDGDVKSPLQEQDSDESKMAT